MNTVKNKPARNGDTAPSLTGSDGTRDARGRFGAGNRFSRGNVNARKMAELRRVLLDGVTPKMIAAVVERLVHLATYGNLDAVKLLFSYSLGQPRRPDADGPDDEADTDPVTSEREATS